MDMNIQGVAYASLIAQIYGCIVGFIAIYKRGNLIICSEYIQSLKTLQPFLAMMKVNVDLMFRIVCLLTINNLFAIAGASMGTVTLASNAIILEIIFIVVYFIDGMANGVSVFSGKAKGYKDINLLNSVLKISLRCLAVFIIFISVIMYITKSYFINMMTDLAIVANYANDYSIYLILLPGHRQRQRLPAPQLPCEQCGLYRHPRQRDAGVVVPDHHRCRACHGAGLPVRLRYPGRAAL